MPRFRIGIDLGTSNCALASVAGDDHAGHSVALEISQAETEHSSAVSLTLPSFLYLPPQGGQWIAGRFARSRAAEVPGRVVSSAKSWLLQHASDRHAGFLPLGSMDIPQDALLSPVDALAELLRTLTAAWDSQYPDALLTEQEIAITVPASFDPIAQRLTLEAAREAGFPKSTILLEEPQSAFYAWLEQHGGQAALDSGGKTCHVLVIDLGGGTTDFSLFSLEAAPDNPSGLLRRIAVSDHILLGGDNLDLAVAHDLERRLGRELPPAAFSRLLSRSREIKEEALGSKSMSDAMWPVAIALPGASLLAGSLRTEIAGGDVRRLLIEGFFPDVGATERPLKPSGGLREAGLPYAKDPAITRHLADFLRERPQVDFVLFNGGLTKAPLIRSCLVTNITRWQDGRAPVVLESPEPDLAVARGAARFLHLRAANDPSRIEAGAAYSYYVGVGQGRALCVLPHGASQEHAYTAETQGLRALVGKAASFPLYRHAKRLRDKAGSLVEISVAGLSELPPVETLLSPPKGAKSSANNRIQVRLRTTLRSTGLLRVELLCAESSLNWKDPWPLEFSLRSGVVPASSAKAEPAKTSRDSPGAVAAMARWLQPLKRGERLTPNAVFSAAEKVLGELKASWRADTIRNLFDGWATQSALCATSPEHEEVWLHVAGYLLRPGCGMPGDDQRVDALWTVLGDAPRFSRASVKLQRWICGRRIAAGLDADRSIILWERASADWKDVPSAEIALLAGALESLPQTLRADLALRMAGSIELKPKMPALWTGLGRLLSRALFHGGTAQVVTPETVVAVWELLRDIEVEPSVQSEAALAWLRAGRKTGLRSVDIPGGCRNEIDGQLRRWELTDMRRRVLHEAVPLVVADRSALLGESLPGGLTILE